MGGRLEKRHRWMTDANNTTDSSTMQVDTDLVRKLAELLDDTRLTEIEVQDGDRRIRVARTASVTMQAAPMAMQAAPAAAAPAPVATADRQPWRDRLPHHRICPEARPPHGRRVLRSGPGRQARPAGR
jgi:hypothetical protein